MKNKMGKERYKTILEYNDAPDNQCYTCKKYYEYSMMAAHYCDYDGECEVDGHCVLGFRQCEIGQYEHLPKNEVTYI